MDEAERDDGGATREALCFAAQEGACREVRDLLAAGHNPDLFDELGHTPLHYAAEGEHLDIVRLLVEAGADVNARCETQATDTPLGHVAGRCSYDMARLLVDSGADPRLPGGMQLTALSRASRRLKPEGRRVLKLLESVPLRPPRRFDDEAHAALCMYCKSLSR